MKYASKVAIRIIPALLIVALMVTLFVVIEKRVVDTTEQDSDQSFLDATMNMADKVDIRFTDNLETLERIAAAVAFQADSKNMSVSAYLKTDYDGQEYLRSERSDTIFERLDVLFPDDTLLVQGGSLKPITDEQLPYAQVLKQGVHMSARVVDSQTNRETVYCVTPVKALDGQTAAILIGAVDCRDMAQLFTSFVYGENADVFVIDREDGQFIVDSRHDAPGDLQDLRQAKLTSKYAHVNFAEEVLAGKSGCMAFYPADSDEVHYMQYMPIFDEDNRFYWTLGFMVREAAVFEHVNEIKDTLDVAGRILYAVVVVYVVWVLFIVFRSEKNAERAQKLETERATNEARAFFLSSVSHDIRTPLNGIVGMLEVIERHGDDPERVRECLDKIKVSTRYLTNLANDVLDINEIENGKVVLTNDVIDLECFAEELQVLALPRAKQSGIACHISCGSITNRYVKGSLPHINRVMMNLISNAIKYNRPGGEVFVTVEERAGIPRGSMYAFVVRDTGIGMTESFQQNMFHAFTQENAGARTRHSGHGLGLFIVKKLVDKMNGTVEVKSKVGIGSTFTVTLPLLHDEEGARRVVPDLRAAKALEGVELLVAEDNELNMEIVKAILTDAGAKLTTVTNGKEAVKAFAQSPPFTYKAILLDLMMPQMDGLEATKAMRVMEREDARFTPIIAMTASAFAEDVQRCKEAGMDAHVAKPLDAEKLIALILRHVR